MLRASAPFGGLARVAAAAAGAAAVTTSSGPARMRTVRAANWGTRISCQLPFRRASHSRRRDRTTAGDELTAASQSAGGQLTFQVVPFQCRIRTWPRAVPPAAQALVAGIGATPARPAPDLP